MATPSTLKELRALLATRAQDGRIAVSQQVEIGGTNLVLQGKLHSHKALHLELAPGADSTRLPLHALADFASAGTATHLFPDTLPFFDALKVTHAGLTFGFDGVRETQITFGLAADGDWQILDSDLFTLREVGIDLTVRFLRVVKGRSVTSTGARLHAKTDVDGREFDIFLDFAGRDDWRFTVAPKDGDVLPALADLAGEVGGASLKSTVQTGLKALEIDDFAIDGISVGFDPHAKRLRTVSLRSHMTLLGGRIDLYTQLRPHFQLAGGLPPGAQVGVGAAPASSIQLKPLVEHYFGAAENFPEIDVTALSFFAAPGQREYQLGVEITDDWNFHIAHRSFALREVSLQIQKAGKTVTGAIACQLKIADIAFNVSADHPAPGEGWSFEGSTGGGQKISLTAFVGGLLELFDVSLPSSVPDISLSYLHVQFDTGTKMFAFSCETAAKIDVPFLPGDADKIHAAVDLRSDVDPTTGKRQLSGHMEGDLTLGSSKFTLQYELGKDTHVFKASWQSTRADDLLGIDTLLKALGIDNNVSIPSSVDLNLKKVYFEYQAERETLTLVADSASYGDAFLIASKLPIGDPGTANPPSSGDGSWQFVFGWSYPGHTKLSQIPGLGKELGAADILSLEEIGVILSSADIQQFTIPELPGLQTLTSGSSGSPPPTGQASSGTRKPVGFGNTLPLRRGIAFVATLDLGQDDSAGKMKSLRKVSPVPKLFVMAAYGEETLTLSAMFAGSATKLKTGGSSDLKLERAGVRFIFDDGVTFELFGKLGLHFDQKTFDVTLILAISPEALEASVDVKFEQGGWRKPMGIPGLTLDEAGFEIGIEFLPAPGLDLGLEGKSHIGDQHPASDDFAFVLEIVEEVPDPLLLSFYFEELDVKVGMELFAPDAKTPSLPDFVNQLKVTQLSFYWAESVVTLPDGTVHPPGLRFSGNVEVLSFKAHAALAIDQVSGMMGDLELSPIHIGHTLAVTGHGRGVYVNQRGGKPVHRKIRPDKHAQAVERVQVVPPGGAALQFQTSHSPYLFASFIVDFMDRAHLEVEALVSSKGMLFKLIYDVTQVAHAELDFTLKKSGFHLYSQLNLHLKAELGPVKIADVDFGNIHLDAGFDLELRIDATPETFDLKISGDFEYEGARLTLPTLQLDVALSSLTELPERILKHIADHLEEIFGALFDDAKQLIEDAGKEIAHLGEEAGKEVAKVAEAAAEEAKQTVVEAEKAVAAAEKKVVQGVKDLEIETAAIEKKAAQEVKKIGQKATQDVKEIAHEIDQVASAAAHEIEAIGAEIDQEAQAVEHAVERLGAEAVDEVKKIGEAAEKDAAKILGDAQEAARRVLAAAREVADWLEEEARQLLDEAQRLAEAAERALEAASHAVEHTAKKAWHTIKKY